jgi:hypothetical protein
MKLTSDNLYASLSELSPEKRIALTRECKDIAVNEELQIGGRAISFFTIPLVLEEAAMTPVLGKIGTFLDALIRLEEYALAGEGKSIMERLMASLTPGGQHLVSQCTYESPSSLRRRMRRFDGFLEASAGSYSLIEVNQAAPLAIHYHDAGQRIAAHVVQSLGFSWTPRLLAPHVLEWMLAEYGERHEGAMPATIALVIEHGYPPKFTDLPRMARSCEAIALAKYGHRLTFITCFPYEIKLRAGEIICQDRKIDMIWRNSVYLTSYREERLDVSDYERISSSPDRHILINSTRSWLTRTKEVFAILWDDEAMREMGFTGEAIASLRTVVPLTVNLGRSRNRDLEREIVSDRERWISKPTDSGFGKGVEFGEAHTKESWARLLDERRVDGFIFQQKIPYPTLECPDIDGEGTITGRSIDFDFCPHHVNGAFTGTALVRANLRGQELSPAQTMNLASGGLLYPLVVI